MAASTLSNLMQQVPGQNKQVLTGLQEAAKTQVQAGFGSQGPMGQPMGVRQIQQLGAQATAAQGQAAISSQQQTVEKAGQLGEMTVQEQAAEAQQRLQARQLGLQRQQRDLDTQLKNFNSKLHVELVERETQFQRDEMGRTLFNERQLMDYKLSTAQSQIEIKNLETQMRAASAKRIQMLQACNQRLLTDLKEESAKSEQEKDQASILRIEKAQLELKRKLEEERQSLNAKAAKASAIGALAGGIIGAFIGKGGPSLAKAAIGAKVGFGAARGTFG
jgi:hypothetical protein